MNFEVINHISNFKNNNISNFIRNKNPISIYVSKIKFKLSYLNSNELYYIFDTYTPLRIKNLLELLKMIICEFEVIIHISKFKNNNISTFNEK